jgi:hypothetical protein
VFVCIFRMHINVGLPGVVCELADQLSELGVENVTVESTPDYERAQPGQPDKLHPAWLSKLIEKGLLAAKFRAADADPAAAQLHPTEGRFDPRPLPAHPSAGLRRLRQSRHMTHRQSANVHRLVYEVDEVVPAAPA